MTCSDGMCGLDSCARCGAGEETYVPQAGRRGPKGPAVSERLRELRARSRAGGLTLEESVEADRLEDERAYVQAEDERRDAAPAVVPATSADDAAREADRRARTRAAFAYESETVRASRYAEWLGEDEATAARRWFDTYSDTIPERVAELAAGYLRRRRDRREAARATAEATAEPHPLMGRRVVCRSGRLGCEDAPRTGIVVGGATGGVRVRLDPLVRGMPGGERFYATAEIEVLP